mmetsp:Transcript_1322/g.4397  ORF Transcript_1322/g.4397 Transcript_1322/m.4397 type:complete len:223 (+) Transcript_1322:747-1415(+)|eukprot:31339-Pelagococcus_subviridis.AAC.3
MRRDAAPRRALRGLKRHDRERDRGLPRVRLRRGRDGVHPRLQRRQRVEQRREIRRAARRDRRQEVDQRWRLLDHLSLVRVSPAPAAQVQELEAVFRLRARLRERAEERLSRDGRDVHGAREDVADDARASDVRQRRRLILILIRRRVLRRPRQVERALQAQTEPGRELGHELRVVTREDADGVPGLVRQRRRAFRRGEVKLEMQHAAIGSRVGHELRARHRR